MINEAILRKKGFFKILSAAIREPWVSGIESIDYKCFKDKHLEILKMTYTDGFSRYINVTANSEQASLIEIAREINGQHAVGAIDDYKHAELVERWWTESEAKEC